MRYVVLDTNALIQALPTKSPYHRIWSDFLGGKYRLCVSNEILSEYEEILSIHTSPKVAHNVVEAIARHPLTHYRESYYRFRLRSKVGTAGYERWMKETFGDSVEISKA